MMIEFGHLKFQPVKYFITSEHEISGWWVFKKYTQVWYINSEFIKYGPMFSLEEAVDIKRSMELN